MQVRWANSPAFCGRLLGCEGDLESEQALGPSDRGSAVTLNGVDVPFWASWIAVTVGGALSFVGFRAAMRS